MFKKYLEKLETKKGPFYRWLKIFVFSIKDFIDDEGFDKAATLTFYSLLSLIPMVAIGFGIAQMLGFDEKFNEQIKEQLYTQPEIADKLIQFSKAALKQSKGEFVAGVGILVLLWTVLRMIGNIGTYFDKMWGIKKSPTFWQQIKRYVPMIILFPVFLIGASSLILLMSTITVATTHSVQFLEFFSPFVTFLFALIPYGITWILLSFMYYYLPNTKVKISSALKAGVIAGILFQIWQLIYITFQANAASYGVIYGSFAAVPLFLLWLNYSWLIVLFGSELTYNFQKNN